VNPTMDSLEHPSGVVALIKPPGISSAKFLNEFKNITGFKKVGHAGTLDPAAEGILVTLVGKATRLAEYFQNLEKFYIMHVLFGIKTNTGDLEGEVIEEKKEFELSEDKINSVLSKFQGWIEQIPPMFSAVKHKGKRLYKLARKGVEVVRSPRKVFVKSITLRSLEDNIAVIELITGKGVYARQIAVDIGETLGIPSTVKKLVRVAVGDFSLNKALTLEDIKKAVFKEESFLLNMNKALYFLPTFKASWEVVSKIANGQVVQTKLELNGKVKLISPDGEFVAIVDAFKGVIKPEKVFLKR